MAYTQYAVVSFTHTPLNEISGKAAEIRALGWREGENRGDPWVVGLLEKEFPDEASATDAELRQVMGDYWLDDDAFKALLGSK